MTTLAATLAMAALLGCGGGGGGAAADSGSGTPTASVPAAPAAPAAPAPTPATPTEPAPAAPYTRLVWVDPSHAAASDATGSGTAAKPYKTIAAALRGLQPGDDVVVAAGVYREALSVPATTSSATATPAPVRLRAATARSVTVKGSDLVGGWTPQPGSGRYVLPWSGDEPQQVFRNGVALQQVGGTVFGGYPVTPGHELAAMHAAEGGIWPGRVSGTLESATADAFQYDAVRREIALKLATPLAAGEKLEVATRRLVLQAEGAVGLTVEGIDFVHANTSTSSRWGAVKISGRNNRLHDIVVRDMDSVCVQLSGSDSTLSNSTLENCGRTGLAGSGQRLTITGNRIAGANHRGFNKWWEAGGMKLIGDEGVRDSAVKDNVVAFNQGDGIWIDWMNSGNLIENNTTAFNAGFGIHYEASRTATIRNNRSYGNAQRGVYLMEAADNTIEGNVVVGNAMEGIGIVDGTRSGTYPALRPTGNRVVNNVLAWNDQNRNWVQLVLPGAELGNSSDRNVFVAETLAPRLSLGFVAPQNPAYTSLAAWSVAVRLDASSQSMTVSMPSGLRQALSQRRLMSASELSGYLASPVAAN
jgi:parallel beta-helix repeat protein